MFATSPRISLLLATFVHWHRGEVRMRLRHALPAGVVDAGCNSLATLVMGVYAARALAGPGLGTYALFFSAYVLAVVVPMQFVLVPAEIAALRLPGRERLAVLRQAGRIGVPVALLA